MKDTEKIYEIKREGDVMRVILTGEMDHHNAVAARRDIDELIFKERPKRLRLDLSGIGFMDSSGLGFVMGRYSLMQKIGGELVLEHPNERVCKIFELAGLERIVRIEKEEAK